MAALFFSENSASSGIVLQKREIKKPATKIAFLICH